jgi:hypothetical protein
MGVLTFSIEVTLESCVDHQEGIVDDETHPFFTRLVDVSRECRGGASTWPRATANQELFAISWSTRRRRYATWR